jgi:hypothetical protein
MEALRLASAIGLERELRRLNLRIARFVVVIVVAAVAPLLASPRTSPAARTDTLAVQVNLEFDRSITSNTIKAIARDEAAAVWRVYGVELRWTDSGARAAVTLDVIVGRYRQRVELDGSPAVLGYTTIASAPAAPAPIRVSFDAVDSLIERRPGADPLLHQREIGTALGRVLAHEVGHVLLGAPAYHDPDGLMRATFPSDDLVRPERSLFRLTPHSVARLQVRITSLSRPPSSESGVARPSH